jgi:hypothetical protein
VRTATSPSRKRYPRQCHDRYAHRRRIGTVREAEQVSARLLSVNVTLARFCPIKRRLFLTVERPSSKRYRAYSKHDGRRVYVQGTFATKAEAGAWLANTETDLRRATWADAHRGPETLRQYAGTWMKRTDVAKVHRGRRDFRFASGPGAAARRAVDSYEGQAVRSPSTPACLALHLAPSEDGTAEAIRTKIVVSGSRRARPAVTRLGFLKAGRKMQHKRVDN